jgi:hypothetical protein
MAFQDHFIAILRKLLDATQSGKLVWSETADEETYRVTFRDGMVNVTRIPGAVDRPLRTKYTANLLNEQNTVVAEFDPQNDIDGALLSNLFQAARESALKPDKVLAGIEAELDSRLRRNGNR